MEITLTPDARSFAAEKGVDSLTISSLVFSSCCSGPLPPEVKPGAPDDPEGFAIYRSGDLTIYYDSLLDPRPSITINVMEYIHFRELVIEGWE